MIPTDKALWSREKTPPQWFLGVGFVVLFLCFSL